jgi:hypothetical protein
MRLEVFNRKYGVASDDLGYTAILVVLIRLSWIPLLIIPSVDIYKSSCSNFETVGFYVWASLSMSVLLLAVGITQSKLSFSGTVNNDKPRKFVG